MYGYAKFRLIISLFTIKIRKWILSQRKRDIDFIFKIILHTLSIVAFFVALDYFSKKPSIFITIRPMMETGFFMDSVKKFYAKNGLSIPLVFNEYKRLQVLFEDEIWEENEILVGSATSDMDTIKALIKGQKISEEYVKIRIDKLKEQIKNYSFRKQGQIYMTDEYYDEERFTETLKHIESRITSEEYYIFLSALIQSRKIYNSIVIENNGDIDLKDLKIIIPAPMSKVYGNRKNNIFDFNIESLVPRDVVPNTEDLTINLPSLKIGKIFSLVVFTRENKIEEKEILSSYEEEKLIDKKKAMRMAIGVFIILTILKLFFRGKIPRPVEGC